MPVLRNQRYDSFENNLARDAFRGLPLQQFPWVMEKYEVATAQGELIWTLEVSCLNATPSGFGAKLNFELRATAALTPASVTKNVFESQGPSRVGVLFAETRFELEEQKQKSVEGLLAELPKLAKEFGKEFSRDIAAQWTVQAVRDSLRRRLQGSTPGGFGERFSMS